MTMKITNDDVNIDSLAKKNNLLEKDTDTISQDLEKFENLKNKVVIALESILVGLKHYVTSVEENQDTPTPSLLDLEENSILREENQYLKQQNWILINTTQELTSNLTDLTYKYEELQENSTNAMLNFRNELKKLREDIDLVQSARTLKFVLPSSWISDEDTEDE